MRFLLLAALLAAFHPALARAGSPSCREGFECPGRAGRVDVTLAGFDGSAASGRAGILDADEIQCAFDCLDGDPDPDHVLAGPGTPTTASPVRGGAILFDPSVTYHVQRSLKLPATSRDPLIVDGMGARLQIQREGSAAISVIERRAPVGANNCDVELMAIWSSLWTIQNLTFEGDGSVQDSGIVIHGANSPTVRNCLFASLGIGVDMRFALVGLVEQCMFINNRKHDIILADGGSECGPTGTCFGGCGTGPAIFTKAGSSTRQLTEGGCNSAAVRHCRFLMHPQQLASIRIRGSRSVVLDQPVFDGARGRHAIHHSHPLANELTIRDMYFETNVERSEGIIRFDGGSRLLVEGMHLVTGVPSVAIDAGDNTGATLIVRSIPWMPPNIRFANGTNPWRHQWRFEDVAAADLALPSRWTGGPPPLALAFDDIRNQGRPTAGAVGSLSVPVGSPQERGEKLEDGQVWIEKGSRRLMFCCDPHGRPKAASR